MIERFTRGAAALASAALIAGAAILAARADGATAGLGRDWVKVSEATSRGLPGEPSRGFAFGALSYGGAMWKIAGANGQWATGNVYRSVDGVTWSAVIVEPAFRIRSGHAATVFQNEMWIVGGVGINKPVPGQPLPDTNDAWHSTDGATWTLAPRTAPFTPARVGHGIGVLGGRMWIAGGAIPASLTTFSEVWSSADGATWTKSVADAPFGRRTQLGMVTFDGKLWVVGGWRGGATRFNDVWSSADGVSWVSVTSDAGFPARSGHSLVVHDGRMWVIGGQGPGGRRLNDVWSSQDGVTWTKVTDAAAFSPRYGHQAVSHDGRLWLLGGSPGESPYYSAEVWSSQ